MNKNPTETLLMMANMEEKMGREALLVLAARLHDLAEDLRGQAADERYRVTASASSVANIAVDMSRAIEQIDGAMTIKNILK